MRLMDEGIVRPGDFYVLGACLALILNAVVVWHLEHKDKDELQSTR